MRRHLIAAFGICYAIGARGAHGQTADAPTKPLQWDVISVKSMAADKCAAAGGGVAWLKDGLSASCVPVGFVVQVAYQLFDQTRIVGLPEWARDSSHLYAIEARVGGEDAAAFSKLDHEDKLRMLQPALADRFQMKAHKEARETSAYDLVVAKSGQKLKATTGEGGSNPRLAPTGSVKWANAPLTNLIWLLSAETGRPVVDKTGLTGKYDFTLEFTPAARAGKDDSGRPSVFTALEEQLGLKLVPAKEPVDVLVIDSIEQPGAN
jgi:uncharacterized protein (TIGR03435 family)